MNTLINVDRPIYIYAKNIHWVKTRRHRVARPRLDYNTKKLGLETKTRPCTTLKNWVSRQSQGETITVDYNITVSRKPTFGYSLVSLLLRLYSGSC